MYRIVDISCRLKNDSTLEILKERVFKPTKEKLIKRVNYYENKKGIVSYGYIYDYMILGLIVLEKINKNKMIILDIAVRRNKQKLGIGSELLNYVIYELKPRILVAETDDDAVGFYEKKQFEIVNLGKKYSNINRYECRYFNLYND
ncbi:ribosomal-protein-alanine acetyltransferase [[Clostridium] sordellii]|uniref:GNAT family N-acetyltransferase n=1 Tax=Paraclostridium sordellii TaxID=1505 RepID=UPI0005DBDD28|nr:GNAT family N-acetyltransferase [Paeniclostridium sordellii]MDU4414451.1 GNAT family N-acetyltransferase [Paeniclostridium sordellii]CEO34752.1 ribosomal-protein-alanine acetyltransferase [[Clostridium] sordellii] [Paeniclostridium sordellii]CEP93235.1 ribosomal-protein-alanine acetyltransferase [[Clostridium] sordellii] [Paeniclostridium sordellii]CEQ06043.1 ribosomal-protein-alanine acetyltransferase [[Clostridium] sordellii] [Paeniclostridium sordellii]